MSKKKFPSGEEYLGDLSKEGLRVGKGSCKFADGAVYEGEWKDDKMCGQGKFITDDFTYEGEFKDGSRTGQATVVFLKSGSVYVGECVEGQRSGAGTYTWKSGAKYDGSWLNNTRHGLGLYSFPDGTLYSGDFRNGLPLGKGKVTLPDGSSKERCSRRVGRLPNSPSRGSRWNLLRSGSARFNMPVPAMSVLSA
eukprot:RCo035212